MPCDTVRGVVQNDNNIKEENKRRHVRQKNEPRSHTKRLFLFQQKESKMQINHHSVESEGWWQEERKKENSSLLNEGASSLGVAD